MVKPLFDTNIIIDFLNGISAARTEIDQYTSKAISIITWMEVMIGAEPAAAAGTRSFLDSFDVILVDGPIAEGAVAIRKKHRIKLPDAIIWASAEANSMVLVTRNSKDFPELSPGVRIPYKL